MKRLLIIAMLAALVGCSDSAKPLTFPAMPAEFADCKVVRVSNKDGYEVTLARCPNSTATTGVRVQQGKSSYVRTAIVTEGAQ